jgi:hypothetical protein
VQAEQVYVTHCLPADSVSGRPGFEVRATSVSDPLLLQFALEQPAYELPLDLRRPGLTAAEAPCRLALVAAPGGRVALVHTVYVPEDTCGRKNSFFSHILFYPSLTLRQALSTWTSPDWQTDYPSGSTKKLPPLSGLPRPGPLDDTALSAFLADEGKRQTLRRVLQGMLLALRAKDQQRSRLYLLAEPDLTAQLLYGVARLLPEARDKFVPFSTYENMHRVLREYRLGICAGTWTATPDRGLDADYYHTRGYAIDTINGKASPELDNDVPAFFDEAMELATPGEWEELEQVLSYVGRATVPFLRPALETVRALKRLAESDDLLVVLRLAHGTVSDRLLTAFGLLHAPAATEDELKRVLGEWLKLMEGCPMETQTALHRGFLERFVPENQRERVARALSKIGLMIEERPTSTEAPQAVQEPRDHWRRVLIVTHLLALCVGLALALVVVKLLTPP